MVKRNSDATMDMKKVKVKQEKLDESIESFRAPKKEEKDSSDSYGSNSSTLRVKDEKVDLVTIKKEEGEEEEDKSVMWISRMAIFEYSEILVKDPRQVTGYHENRPLNIVLSLGLTTHNFINESLADKLGYDSYPIKPRTVNWPSGKMVTSRACNNFQFTMQGVLFNVKLYLLPLASNCEMVLGNQWMWAIKDFNFQYKGMGFTFEIENEKHFVSFNEDEDEDEGSKR